MDKELSDHLSRLRKNINSVGKPAPKKHKTKYEPCRDCGRPVAVSGYAEPPPICGDCREGRKYLSAYNPQRPHVRTNIQAINKVMMDYEGTYSSD